MSEAEKPTEQPIDNLSEAMEQLSVTTDDSDRTSKPPKNLSDMPCDVVELIIERSGYKEQLKLRKVSKSLRALVDKLTPACQSIYIQSALSFIVCAYNDQPVSYRKPERIHPEEFNGIPEKLVMRDNYEKIAFDDLASTLKNPKLKLEYFIPAFVTPQNPFSYFQDLSRQYAKLREVLESIPHQVSCKTSRVEVNCISNDYYSILPYLKPGVLEKIELDYIYDDVRGVTREEIFQQISELEQWKQAEELELLNDYDDTPMKFSKHFKRFRFNEHLIDGSLLIRIRDHLSTFKNFEYCLIETQFPPDAQKLRGEVGNPAAPNKRGGCISLYSFPDSDDYLEFVFFEKSIEIRKFKKS